MIIFTLFIVSGTDLDAAVSTRGKLPLECTLCTDQLCQGSGPSKAPNIHDKAIGMYANGVVVPMQTSYDR